MAGGTHLRLTRTDWARWYRPMAVGLALTLLGLAAYSLLDTVRVQPTLVATDPVNGYLPGAQRWLATGSPYEPYQLTGPWSLDYRAFIHPPAALPLFAAFLWLPLPLWWAIPIGVTGWCVYRLRPAPWTWPLMAACLVWPRSTGSLLAGNSDLWAMAAVAAGAVYGWPVALLAVKPTFAPLALVGVRDRRAWVAGVIGVLAMLLLLPLWIEWVQVITNNGGLGIGYSLLNVPLVAIGALAWAGSTRRAGAPGARWSARSRRRTAPGPAASRSAP